MGQLNKLQRQVRDTHYIFKRMDRLIHSEMFLEMWEDADEEKKEQLAALVTGCHIKKIRALRVKPLNLEAMTRRELVALAAEQGVRGYSHMIKEDLIAELLGDNDEES